MAAKTSSVEAHGKSDSETVVDTVVEATNLEKTISSIKEKLNALSLNVKILHQDVVAFDSKLKKVDVKKLNPAKTKALLQEIDLFYSRAESQRMSVVTQMKHIEVIMNEYAADSDNMCLMNRKFNYVLVEGPSKDVRKLIGEVHNLSVLQKHSARLEKELSIILDYFNSIVSVSGPISGESDMLRFG